MLVAIIAAPATSQLATYASIAATVLNSLLVAGVGIYAVTVATRQNRNAEERLRIEFFERRLKYIVTANEEFSKEFERVGALEEDDFLFSRTGSPLSERYYSAKREAQFIFGTEVLAAYAKVEAKLSEYFLSRKSFMESTHLPSGWQQAEAEAVLAVRVAQQSLMQAAQPYLDLSRIQVLRPKARRRVGWRIGRLFR